MSAPYDCATSLFRRHFFAVIVSPSLFRRHCFAVIVVRHRPSNQEAAVDFLFLPPLRGLREAEDHVPCRFGRKLSGYL
jgi:hypothetical protein